MVKIQNSLYMFHQNLFKFFNFVFVYLCSLNFKIIQLAFSIDFCDMLWLIFQFLKFFFKFFKLKIWINDWKIFFNFFFKNFNKSLQRGFNWINLKFRKLKWTKTKLDNWNEFLINLEDKSYILAKILIFFLAKF